jgi:hypothetical protein
MVVAKVIRFYVPDNFRRTAKWISPERRGKILEFGTMDSRAARAGDGTGDIRNNPVLDKVVLS